MKRHLDPPVKRHPAERRHGPIARSAVAAGLLLLAIAAVQLPAGAATGPADASTAWAAVIPPTPPLVTALTMGVNTSGRLPVATRVAVVADVAWLQGRLDVILPRIHSTAGLLPIDGVYGASTAAATKFFKTWGNNAHAALHLKPLFAKIDDSVGPTTEAIIALIAAYFQVHPAAGVATSPQSADQTVLIVALNQDRVRFGVPLLTINPQMMKLAQAWTVKVAAAGALSLEDTDTLGSQITSCSESNLGELGQDLARDATAASAEASLRTYVNPDSGTNNFKDAKFTVAGVGAVETNLGVYVTFFLADGC